MDKKLACHDIAMLASKTFIELNMTKYNNATFDELVENLTIKYLEAYQQIEKRFKELPTPKAKVSIKSKSELGL